MNFSSFFIWSIVATSVLTVMMAAPQRLGLSRMSIPMILGMMFVSSHDKALAIGSLIHALNGMVLAAVYVLVFEELGQATWLLGMVGGALHALIVLLVVMPALPGIHPRMASTAQGPDPTRGLEPPGFLGYNYGHPTPVITVAAHLAYGAVLGGFYQLA
jgi:hypothetical protein